MVKDFQTYTFISVNTRIATKLGTGEFKNRFVQDNYTQTAGNKDYIQKLNAIEHSREAYVKGHNTPPGVPTQKGLTGDVEFIAEAYPVVEFGNYDIPEGWENALAKPSQTGVPAQWENPNTTGFETNGEEETNLYFFHSDHLGSTNYLTDKDGVVQQSLVYMPYGEILSETKSYSNPYKFNGKELDTETGLAYYGARYYSPELGVWYGVDPLMEKYPQNGAYVFCNANPVRFVDLDGKATYSSEGENGNVQCQWFDSDKLYYVDEKGNTWKLHSPEPMLSQKNNTTEPSYDQKYGQPVIGGMGEDSKTTSEFTGPSIDGSPKYIDQYKTIKGLIDKLFGKKYDVEKHNVEPKEPKVREYRRLIINHRIIPKEGDKSFGIKNCGIESDTIGILIINFDENGKPVNQDTIPY